MIKARLKEWGYLKNAKKEDWHFLAVLYYRRTQEGKTSTEFVVRGHRKTLRDLLRFVRNQSMTFDEFLAEAEQQARVKPIPTYIRAVTPDEVDVKSSPNESTPESFSFSPQLQSSRTDNKFSSPITHYSNWRPPPSQVPTLPYNYPRQLQNSSVDSSSIYRGHQQFYTTISTGERVQPGGRQYNSSSMDVEMENTSGHESSNSGFSPCSFLQEEIQDISRRLTSSVHSTPSASSEDFNTWGLLIANSDDDSPSVDFLCTKCNQPSSGHFTSIDSLEPRNILNGSSEQSWHLPVSTNEGTWTWISQCFLACIALNRGHSSDSQIFLDQAAGVLRKIIKVQDPLLLNASGLLATILAMHDQGQIAKQVMNHAKEVAASLLNEDDPIRVTMNYHAAAAWLQIPASGIRSEHLKRAYFTFCKRVPADHPYRVTALYNWAWMLKYEKRFEEAEKHLRQAYLQSLKILGKQNMQTVMIMSTLAVCLTDLKREDQQDEAIDLFTFAISGAIEILGHREHPWVLEATRRMNEILRARDGDTERVLDNYKRILWGRAKMLGRKHTFTLGAKTDYENALQRLGRWSDEQGNNSDEQNEVLDLFAEEPTDSWIHISRPHYSPNLRVSKNDDIDTLDDTSGLDIQEGRCPSPASSNEHAGY